MDEFVTPPPLRPGDRVAIVAPSSNPAPTYPHVYERGLERLRTVFDLEPVEFPTATRDSAYLYDHPEARARDLMDAFENPEIRGIVTVLGGNDQVRILEHLDPDVFLDNPTRFYGYSDNTHVSTYLWNLGIVSYAGPCVMVELAMDGSMFDYTVEYTERAFFEESMGVVEPAPAFTDEPGNWEEPADLDVPRTTEPNPGWTWMGGDDRAAGRVWGGCLGVLEQSFLAREYATIDEALEGTILALETSEVIPHPNRVAGTLRALGERGVLARFDGAMIGRAPARSHEQSNPPTWRETYRERQREAISSVFAEYNPDAPIVFDVDFGHTAPTIPVPIGGYVELDPVAESIRFL